MKAKIKPHTKCITRNPIIISDTIPVINTGMPTIIAAAENKATLGEVADTLRDVFGEYSGV